MKKTPLPPKKKIKGKMITAKEIRAMPDSTLTRRAKAARAKIGYMKPKTDIARQKKDILYKVDSLYTDEVKRRMIKKEAKKNK